MSCRRRSSSARRSPIWPSRYVELPRLARLLVVHVDDRADLLQREPEPLAAQDEVEPGAVPAVVDARGAAALGGDQAQVLVVADRAVGDPELLGDLGDRPGPVRRPAGSATVAWRRGLGRGCHGAHRALRLRQRQATVGRSSTTTKGRPMFELSKDHEEFRTLVREFAEAEVAPHVAHGTASTTSRSTSSPRWATSGCSAWSCRRSSAAPSRRLHLPLRRDRGARPGRPVGRHHAVGGRRASASTRSSPTAPRSRRSAGCPTWSPGARSRRSA